MHRRKPGIAGQHLQIATCQPILVDIVPRLQGLHRVRDQVDPAMHDDLSARQLCSKPDGKAPVAPASDAVTMTPVRHSGCDWFGLPKQRGRDARFGNK